MAAHKTFSVALSVLLIHASAGCERTLDAAESPRTSELLTLADKPPRDCMQPCSAQIVDAGKPRIEEVAHPWLFSTQGAEVSAASSR